MGGPAAAACRGASGQDAAGRGARGDRCVRRRPHGRGRPGPVAHGCPARRGPFRRPRASPDGFAGRRQRGRARGGAERGGLRGRPGDGRRRPRRSGRRRGVLDRARPTGRRPGRSPARERRGGHDGSPSLACTPQPASQVCRCSWTQAPASVTSTWATPGTCSRRTPATGAARDRSGSWWHGPRSGAPPTGRRTRTGGSPAASACRRRWRPRSRCRSLCRRGRRTTSIVAGSIDLLRARVAAEVPDVDVVGHPVDRLPHVADVLVPLRGGRGAPDGARRARLRGRLGIGVHVERAGAEPRAGRHGRAHPRQPPPVPPARHGAGRRRAVPRRAARASSPGVRQAWGVGGL